MTKGLWIAVVVLLVFNGLLLTRYLSMANQKKELGFLASTRAGALAEAKEKNFKLKSDVLTAQQIESSTLPDSITQYLGSSPAIVLRVHVNNCNDCVKESLKVMEKLSKTSRLRPVILANFPTGKALQESFPHYFPFKLVRDIPQDSATSTKPYLFVSNGSGKMDNVLLPEWDMTDILEGYHHKLARLYSKE